MTDLTTQPVPGLVSVVLCNYGGARHLDDCLSSLAAQTYHPIEIIVSDNGSTDNSAEVCAKYPAVRFEFTGANNGLAWAYNVGVSRSAGEFAFCTNNDVWFAPDCIERLVEAIRRRGERCFAVDPLQYNWEKTQVIHYRGVLRPLAKLRELVNNVFSVFPLLGQSQMECHEEAITYMASGGAMMVRRRHFDELGGFDEAFFMDWEDVDLSWRANRRGWECVFVPSAWLRHRWGGTIVSVSKGIALTPIQRRLALSQQYNIMRFALKNHDVANAIVFVAIRLAANVVHVFRGRSYYAAAGIKAAAKVVQTIPDILRQRRKVKQHSTVSNRQLLRRFRAPEGPCAFTWPLKFQSGAIRGEAAVDAVGRS